MWYKYIKLFSRNFKKNIIIINDLVGGQADLSQSIIIINTICL